MHSNDAQSDKTNPYAVLFTPDDVLSYYKRLHEISHEHSDNGTSQRVNSFGYALHALESAIAYVRINSCSLFMASEAESEEGDTLCIAPGQIEYGNSLLDSTNRYMKATNSLFYLLDEDNFPLKKAQPLAREVYTSLDDV